ncbi:MAG: Flp pilus assembly protein CpaB [Chloroflexi bacterium]|nr:Flp pilus assembly protein CpaB [Chloroflexota bacterium]
MKSTGFIWWIGAIILASLAGLVTYQTLTTAAPIADGSDREVTQFVVVAATDIPFRRSITKNELELKKYPLDAVPRGAATNVDQVIGKMPVETILTGEPIMIPKLVTPDIVTRQLALSVPENKVVMAVPMESVLLTNRLIRPGDRIDILGTFEASRETLGGTGYESESIATLQDVEIHAIIVAGQDNTQDVSAATFSNDEESGTFRTNQPNEQSILIAIDLQDALVLRHILDTGGRLDLALRAPDNQGYAQTVPVDQRYLIDRYQIMLSP